MQIDEPAFAHVVGAMLRRLGLDQHRWADDIAAEATTMLIDLTTRKCKQTERPLAYAAAAARNVVIDAARRVERRLGNKAPTTSIDCIPEPVIPSTGESLSDALEALQSRINRMGKLEAQFADLVTDSVRIIDEFEKTHNELKRIVKECKGERE